MKKAIVIGASSGIGRELTKVLAGNGYEVGITARRLHLLEQLKEETASPVTVRHMDVADINNAVDTFHELVAEMGTVDVVVINAGIGYLNPMFERDVEQQTISTNVLGFAALANAAWHVFKRQGSGQLVGISSIAAIRGGMAPAYFASKAFISNYLQGLRWLAARSPGNITVTDIKPGLVDTAMDKVDFVFWMASPEKAAKQIYTAIKHKKKHAYVTKRWRVVGWALKIMPDFIYHRI